MERMSPGRDNNFNFLRFFLASLVLLSHSPELVDGNRNREILTRFFHTLSFGDFAVDCFFILSGFLIVQSWDRAPHPENFLKKRILRIYPGFIIAAFLSALIIGPLGSSPGQYFSQFQWTHFLLGLTQLQISGIPPVFEGQPYSIINAPTWTIAYEFRCYLLVVLIGMCRTQQRKIWPILAVVLLFLAFTGKVSTQIAILLLGDVNSLIHFLTFFCAGGYFYLFRDRIIYKKNWALLATTLLFLCMFREKTAQLGLAVLGSYTLFWFAFAHIPSLNKFKNHPDISYGIYLYGWPIQKLIIWHIPTISPWLLFLICWCLAYLLGRLSWHFVERPFLRLKPESKIVNVNGQSATL